MYAMGLKFIMVMVLVTGLTAPVFGGSYSFVSFDVPGLEGVWGWKINNAGQVVGMGYKSDGYGQAFLKNGAATELMEPFGSNNSSVGGIEENGTVVGGYWNGGFTYHNGTYQHFPINPGAFGDVNNSGLIAGWTPYERGFVMPVGATEWDQVEFMNLPDAIRDGAFGINDANWIAGTLYDSTGIHGYIKKGASLEIIDRPGSTLTFFYDINNLGQVLGFSDGTSFIYHGGSFADIPQFPGGQDTVAYGINDLGHLVGEYLDMDGIQHGFIATPSAPIPGGVVLMSSGLLGYICLRRWHKN